MAQRVKEAMHEALQALRRFDAIGASQIIHDDPDINALQQDIEDLAARFISRWQPLLRDLRRVLALLMVAGELERIGDYAKQIALQVRRAREAGYTPLLTTESPGVGGANRTYPDCQYCSIPCRRCHGSARRRGTR